LSRLPKQPRTLYLLYNNCGYCQNMLGSHAEAIEYCRLAIAAVRVRAARAPGAGMHRA
jgi:hypothetical protein